MVAGNVVIGEGVMSSANKSRGSRTAYGQLRRLSASAGLGVSAPRKCGASASGESPGMVRACHPPLPRKTNLISFQLFPSDLPQQRWLF